MTGKGLDFKHKEVVNINNGKRLGYVQDVCADLNTGSITSITWWKQVGKHVFKQKRYSHTVGKNTLHRGRYYTCRHLKIKIDKNIKKI